MLLLLMSLVYICEKADEERKRKKPENIFEGDYESINTQSLVVLHDFKIDACVF